MRFKHLYSFETRVGTFYISQSTDGRFHPVYDDESLGSYKHPWQAAEDLAGDHTFTCMFGAQVLDTSLLGISADLSDWTRLPQCR